MARRLVLREGAAAQEDTYLTVEAQLTPRAVMARRLFFTLLDHMYYQTRREWPARAHYTATYVELDGGRSSSGRHWSPVWDRLVEACDSAGISVFEYVQLYLQRHLPSGLVAQVQARQLLDARRINEGRELLRLQRRFAVQLRVQQQHLSLRYSQALRQLPATMEPAAREQAARVTALLDSRPPMTALFQYCEGVRRGYRQLVIHQQMSAALQYVLNRQQYNVYWQDHLVPEITGLSDDDLLRLAEGMTADVRAKHFDYVYDVAARAESVSY